MYSSITSGQPKQAWGDGNRRRNVNNNWWTNNTGGWGGNHNPNKTKKSSFERACVELIGAIFNTGSGQIVLYNNTLDWIITYDGKNCTPFFAIVNQSNDRHILPLQQQADIISTIILNIYHTSTAYYFWTRRKQLWQKEATAQDENCIDVQHNVQHHSLTVH